MLAAKTGCTCFLSCHQDRHSSTCETLRQYPTLIQTDCARPTAPKTAEKTACWSHDRSPRLMRQMKTHLVVGGTAKISTFSVRNAASVTLPIKRLTRAERPFVPITNRSGRISETAREM